MVDRANWLADRRLAAMRLKLGLKYMIDVRAFQLSDDPIVTLLFAHSGVDVRLRPFHSLHQAWETGSLIRQTLVAVQEDEIVGVGTVFENTIHPHRLLVIINVAANYQRQGIGTALYHALQRYGDGRPWQAKGVLQDRAWMGFLAKHGFFPIMHTMEGRIDPRANEAQNWLYMLPATVPGVEFVPWPQLSLSVSPGEFAMKLARVYERYHVWSSPAPFSIERATELFMGSDCITDSAIGVMVSGQLIGGSTLYTSEDPTATDLGNFGVIEHVGVNDTAVTAALIRKSIEWAAIHQVSIHFEVDVSYLPHRVVFETAPADLVARDWLNLATG